MVGNYTSSKGADEVVADIIAAGGEATAIGGSVVMNGRLALGLLATALAKFTVYPRRSEAPFVASRSY